MKLTKDEAIANHRRKWNWIADETLKQKRRVEEWDFFKAHGIREIPLWGNTAAIMQEEIVIAAQ